MVVVQKPPGLLAPGPALSFGLDFPEHALFPTPHLSQEPHMQHSYSLFLSLRILTSRDREERREERREVTAKLG